MSGALVVTHTAIALGGIVGLITLARVTPVIAVVAGTLYLGLASGLGFEATVDAVARGFGDLMAEVGLLIGFGVLLGSLLSATGALQRALGPMLRMLTPRRTPYVLSGSLTAFFPAIYPEVMFVLAAPVLRELAPRIDPRSGLGRLAGALTIGEAVGLVFVVPGTATLAISGLLGVPLGTVLLYGTAVAIPTALLATSAYLLLIRYGMWKPATDQAWAETPAGEQVSTQADDDPPPRHLPLPLACAPVLLALVLIGAAAVVDAMGAGWGVISFLGSPVVALFLGLCLAYALAWRVLSRRGATRALNEGFDQCGSILILTGVSGSLAAVSGETGLEDVLAGAFTAGAAVPILLVWLVAAVLHVAVGSVSVAGITAAGILAPLLGQLQIDPVLVFLAAGSGAMFLPHVNSNAFWLFQTVLRLSTPGTLKAHSLAMTLASVTSLPLILLLALIL
ncbi:GntP family permease [Pseudonocardia sp. MH-G8]|uniref:GntP family permease n=1 Tax=Pseudonocardia sp. MH-G8 TaxID=1854588 RepID=UPI000BA13363|nr:hypothetical protein [Pseudonocardia sp. MH-G8]OZM78064.1 hypothetical protein CFP66_32390 [Pseudonocardia sp. MH-G8]